MYLLGSRLPAMEKRLTSNFVLKIDRKVLHGHRLK